MLWKLIKLLLALVIISFVFWSQLKFSESAFFSLDQESASVFIDANKTGRSVNRLVFGDNILWPLTHNGLEETDSVESFYQLENYAADMGTSILRFPGGLFSDGYHWKDGIGPVESRPMGSPIGNLEKQKYRNVIGTDEFLKFAEDIGASATITVNFGTGSPAEAADWVEYTNAPNDGSNPGGREDWAAVRAKNGHAQPYKIVYWEVGNEIFNKTIPGHHNWGHTTAQEYAEKFIGFSQAMKKIDPSVKIGAATYYPGQVGETDKEAQTGDKWNQTVLSIAGSNIDFMAVHAYLPGFSPNDEASYKELFAYYQKENRLFNDIKKEINIYSINKGIELAITEYATTLPTLNMGSAMYLADKLILYLNRLDVKLANHWNLFEDNPLGGWSLLKKVENGRIQRPDWYALRLLAANTGDTKVLEETQSPTFNVSSQRINAGNVSYLQSFVSKDENSLYLILINKEYSKSLKTEVRLANYEAKPEVQIEELTNELSDWNESDSVAQRTVYIKRRIVTMGNPLIIDLGPHSITAVKFNKG